MKIIISHLPREEREAWAALSALRSLFPRARVKREEKDGRKRVYMAILELKQPVTSPNLETVSGKNPCVIKGNR